MINKIFFTLVISITLINFNILSQPKAIVQFAGGYSMPLGDLDGSFGETYNTWTGNGNPDTNTYFMKSGANYGVYVKFPFSRKSRFNITGGVFFNVFSNSISYSDSTGQGTFDLSQRMVNITIGAEWNYYSKQSKFIPYFGAEAMVNLFGGTLNIDEPGSSNEYKMNPTTRIGFQVGAGCDYIIHHNLGITIGAKYAMANVIGKTYEPDLGAKYNLGDGEHTSGTSYYPDKYINYLQFYGGISFYFGR